MVRPIVDLIGIVSQPRNYLSLTGATIRLSITATSSLPLAYQWERDGQPVGGATSSSLTLANVSGASAGSYRVRLSNGDTNIASASASVQLTNALPSPNILSISQNGGSATISFTTVVGLAYTLEYKLFLEDAQWSALGTIQGTGTNENLTDSAASVSTRFYRVRAD